MESGGENWYGKENSDVNRHEWMRHVLLVFSSVFPHLSSGASITDSSCVWLPGQSKTSFHKL